MGQSAWKIAEAKSAAQEKPQENSLQSETAVDALLGQSGETTTSLLSQRQDGVDADRISSPVLSPIASLKPPSMAPGVGGFNIDLPVPRASLATGKAAVAHTRRRELPKPNLSAGTDSSPADGCDCRERRIVLCTQSIGDHRNCRPHCCWCFAMRRENQLSNILEAVTPLYRSLARRGRLIRHVL